MNSSFTLKLFGFIWAQQPRSLIILIPGDGGGDSLQLKHQSFPLFVPSHAPKMALLHLITARASNFKQYEYGSS